MGQERSHNLAIPSIGNSMARSSNFDDVIDTAEQKARRKEFH